ncbi:NADH-quinone oxidoreductase subunit C [Tessaracoccus rhinocerotis]|uniref:NADH-quinone oxidoreductase subunit C n=1 Tax=Tessaracoccus rhinocerotis TaxID=1689449 RepID=A0A553K5H3_9ACTN|nr:NADH-quinone oxidoreductase subunit C [Tessaracoccus rhinocerotis]TRY19957.1 NADH-quinone oxidoreductase subunit C [Tessaracoccus rhinocerotis]
MAEGSGEVVAAGEWFPRVERARAEGFVHLANLTAVDEVGLSDHIRVLLFLTDAEGARRLRLDVLVDRDRCELAGITPLYAGAAWLQRQVHDFFGVRFTGDDNRPLLNHGGGTPLRKDFLLEPRIQGRWPGALEPGESDASPGRRRLVPPGVPEAGLLDNPDATAAEIALSASGTRVRRGR